jgi:glycosyltransferase involved in cell wall biosynthesis
MVGDGPLLAACRDIVSVLGMSDEVRLLGRQSHQRVAQTMAGARAFVQHSVTAENGDTEGTPVAVMEAGAAGLPAVATRHAGILDVVVEGETGLLVDERDVAGMAAHMTDLAVRPEQAARLGRAARERIAAEFSVTQRTDELWRIVQEAMGET